MSSVITYLFYTVIEKYAYKDLNFHKSCIMIYYNKNKIVYSNTKKAIEKNQNRNMNKMIR